MEKMNDLNDLFRHEIQDLYSAEEQILEALPKMIEKATHPELKKALSNHLKVTREHKQRLSKIQDQLMGGSEENDQGLLSRLFKGRQVCRGMEGIIAEGEKIMKEDMAPEVMDAAIIASAQKVEHYEICSYGTARTFARELNMESIARSLEQTLNEEYYSDDLLTQLAESRINKQAEASGDGQPRTRESASRTASATRVAREEREVELASAAKGARSGSSSRQAQGAPRGSSGGRSTSAPTGRSSTRNASTSRSGGTRNASSGKTSSRSGSNRSSGGRGSDSSRGNSRSR
ncbi:MAG TPA: DUF892 family protein [Flavisolibacter sp.]